MSSRVVMQVFDEDKLSDEIVGSILFNVKDIIKMKVITPCHNKTKIGRRSLLEECIWFSTRLLRRQYQKDEC